SSHHALIRIYYCSDYFFFYCYRPHRDLPSFPTRRSSDLASSPSYLRVVRNHERPPFNQLWRRVTCTCRKVRDGWMILLQSSHFLDRKSTRLNSSHVAISYAVFCLKKKKKKKIKHNAVQTS